MCDWLPDLILPKSKDADGWREFEGAVYEQFKWDFVEGRPMYEGKPVYINLRKVEGKEESFWHVVTRDFARTGDRELEPRRAERIAWVRAVIEGAAKPDVRVWDNVRGAGRKHRLLWVPDAEHLVVLGHGSTAWWLITAYPTFEPHTQRKLQREWEENQNG